MFLRRGLKQLSSYWVLTMWCLEGWLSPVKAPGLTGHAAGTWQCENHMHFVTYQNWVVIMSTCLGKSLHWGLMSLAL
jgi:hypothetical protein